MPIPSGSGGAAATYETGVLVVGGGIAGLASAISARQSGADTGSHFGNGDGLLIGADGTIGQFDIGHGGLPGKIWTKKKCGASRTFLLTKLTRLRFLNFDTSSEQHYQPHQEFW